MTMETLEGKRVAVVGAGRSGAVSARLLLAEGARVAIFDERPREDVEATLGEALPYGAAFERGLPAEAHAAGIDLVVLSPGVPRAKLPMDRFRAAGVPVWGELELGYRRFRGRVAAVAGTNGKSTVTTLLGEMARLAFPRVFIGGNLGTPLAAAAGAAYDWGIVEVSSFQLESIALFRPDVAVLLNITEDHSDRYPSFGDYAQAKMEVFRNQAPTDIAVVNADDPEIARRSAAVRARRVPFALSGLPPGGVGFDGTDIVADVGGVRERYPRAEIRIAGLPNVENAMAAIGAARAMGVPAEVVREVLAAFPGLPHRVEFVRTVRGVSFYNDSKGTNVGAVIKCLEGFPGPVVLVAGGKDKGIDFRPLREPLARRARAAVLIGEARERMERELAGAVPLRKEDSLDGAVRTALSLAAAGDAVVLSPACSSFDMFRDYSHRAEVFRTAVERLVGREGML